MGKLRLHPSYYIIRMDENRVQLRREDGHIVIIECEGKADFIIELLEHLDGSNTVDNLILTLNSSKEEIEPILKLLKEKKVLKEEVEKMNRSVQGLQEIINYQQLLFFSHFTKDENGLQKRIGNSRVTILGTEELSLELLRNLSTSGIKRIKLAVLKTANRKQSFIETKVGKEFIGRLAPEIEIFKLKISESKFKDDIENLVENCDLTIVCHQFHAPNVDEVINEVAIRKVRKWLKCGITGTEGYIGPTVIPYETACDKCYQLRLQGNIQHYEEYLAFQKYLRERSDRKPFGYLFPFITTIAALAAWEAVKVLIHSEDTILFPLTYGRQIVINFNDMSIKMYKVLKIPKCPVCGISLKSVMTNIWEYEANT